jgi:UDP-glucose 4-epimerase
MHSRDQHHPFSEFSSAPKASLPVLVTGGAGYVGSHAAKALSRCGYEPIVLDNFRTGHRSAVKWGPLVEGDLADGSLIREVIAGFNVRAVMHFAANAYVGESVRRPRKYFRNNVANTLNVLEAMMDTASAVLSFLQAAPLTAFRTEPRFPRTTPRIPPALMGSRNSS